MTDIHVDRDLSACRVEVNQGLGLVGCYRVINWSMFVKKRGNVVSCEIIRQPRDFGRLVIRLGDNR